MTEHTFQKIDVACIYITLSKIDEKVIKSAHPENMDPLNDSLKQAKIAQAIQEHYQRNSQQQSISGVPQMTGEEINNQLVNMLLTELFMRYATGDPAQMLRIHSVIHGRFSSFNRALERLNSFWVNDLVPHLESA